MIPRSETATARLTGALIGAGAGLSVWALTEALPDMIGNPRIVLLLVAAGLGFFGVLLALLGPVRPVPAALAALGMAAPAAALLLWASFRHANVEPFLDQGYAVAAFIYLLAVGAPFAAAGLHRSGGWRHYGMLFDAAWSLAVRGAAAWLFVAAVWLVLLLSDQVLGLVGIRIIKDMIALDPVPYIVSGLVLGLGIAIVDELRDYVSPFLAIQLLRVLLPALLVVLAIFIAALPFRGLSNLFGDFSAAATLVSVTVAGVTLITTAIHRDDGMSVQGTAMLTATRLLSAILPVPAALALWAVWLRVDQYGLTPDRVAALVAAGAALIYAVAYAAALTSRTDWRRRQRGVNRAMALVTLAIAALWLTPVLNAERMSTASQIARAEAGAPEAELGLWEMAHEWGVAGRRGLDRLTADAEAADNADLLARIERTQRAESKWDYDSADTAAQVASLEGVVPLRPEGRSLPASALDRLAVRDRRMIRDACARRAPGGHPGCVIVIAPFEPELGREQAIGLYLLEGGAVRIVSYRLEDGALTAEGHPRDASSDLYPTATPRMIADILEGQFLISPAPRNVLEVGGLKLFPQN